MGEGRHDERRKATSSTTQRYGVRGLNGPREPMARPLKLGHPPNHTHLIRTGHAPPLDPGAVSRRSFQALLPPQFLSAQRRGAEGDWHSAITTDAAADAVCNRWLCRILTDAMEVNGLDLQFLPNLEWETKVLFFGVASQRSASVLKTLQVDPAECHQIHIVLDIVLSAKSGGSRVPGLKTLRLVRTKTLAFFSPPSSLVLPRLLSLQLDFVVECPQIHIYYSFLFSSLSSRRHGVLT